MKTHPYDRFRDEVAIVMQSKLDEFQMYDYTHVTEADLWNFLVTKKWRKPQEDIHIHEIVRDILKLQVSDFISFQTVEHLKGPDWFSGDGAEELKELLK